MHRVFISSTYEDLEDHRQAVIDTLARLKQEHSAMEYFGSRGDAAVPASKQEIAESSIFIGVYAWRYGWVPEGSTQSVTEMEFDHARALGKTCLCYWAHEDHPWPPTFIDVGEQSERLMRFKQKVDALVRSTFTTPDDLAKQVAADVARELAPERQPDSFGGLLKLNWDTLSEELQTVFLEAYKRMKNDSRDDVVATRHVVAALVATGNSAGSLLHQMDKNLIGRVVEDSGTPAELHDAVALAQAFSHEQPFSHCVRGSLARLLPAHSDRDRLLAVELAADLLKNGRGRSVEKFRRAGIDGATVDTMMRHAADLSQSPERVATALRALPDAEINAIAYAASLDLSMPGEGSVTPKAVLDDARRQGKVPVLVGEILRRRPEVLA